MKFLQDMEKEKLIEIILDKRIYDGCPDETMPRCPYNIGDEQKECENFVMMDGYVDGEPFYCNNCLIEDSKGWCEIGYDDHNETIDYAIQQRKEDQDAYDKLIKIRRQNWDERDYKQFCIENNIDVREIFTHNLNSGLDAFTDAHDEYVWLNYDAQLIKDALEGEIEQYDHNLTTNHFGGDTGIDADYMKGAEK